MFESDSVALHLEPSNFLIKKYYWCQAVVVPPLIPAHGWQRQADLHEFETSLV